MRERWRVYGCEKFASGEALAYLGLGVADEQGVEPPALAEWKRKHLPLKCLHTDFDFTPQGQVALLRRRGYGDAEIVGHYPDLAGALS